MVTAADTEFEMIGATYFLSCEEVKKKVSKDIHRS